MSTTTIAPEKTICRIFGYHREVTARSLNALIKTIATDEGCGYLTHAVLWTDETDALAVLVGHDCLEIIGQPARAEQVATRVRGALSSFSSVRVVG